ncbi:histidine kinase [Spongiactinospora sp. TRM90649]|uniref:sensor histidine kinase n=1 Tax=Spongiactinospora sp. TRM90649 TaxID=3031114 RepID=UPI0023F9146A|nr:histidine kinase [Spongiactinospora sp. TRM90649]MDF5755372.1 histidine kinase [Spongiactinospora sp. TRM90649]
MGRVCFGAALGVMLVVAVSLRRALRRQVARSDPKEALDDGARRAFARGLPPLRRALAGLRGDLPYDPGRGLPGDAVAEVYRERRRIARELHDTVGHGLLVIAMHARRLPSVAPEAGPVAESIDDMVRVVLADMRRMVGVLRGDRRPAAAERGEPLSARVASVVGQVPSEDSARPVELTISGAERRLPEPVETIALRVVREGLTNALKYGDGTTVRVMLGFGGARLSVSVRNGCGQPAGYVPRAAGHGLTGLRESVITEGGGFVCGPLSGGGFLVQAWLPVQEHVRANATGHAGGSTETGEAHEMCPSAHR